eukprot:1161236-Pelagomonas_calceolata.AAC.4
MGWHDEKSENLDKVLSITPKVLSRGAKPFFPGLLVPPFGWLSEYDQPSNPPGCGWDYLHCPYP